MNFWLARIEARKRIAEIVLMQSDWREARELATRFHLHHVYHDATRVWELGDWE